MRYCGHCGKPLDMSSLQSGVCPACGKVIPPTDPDTASSPLIPGADPLAWRAESADDWGPTVPLEARLSPDDGLAILSARPTDTVRLRVAAPAPAESPPNSLTVIALAIGLGVAVLLVLACTLSFGSVIFGGSQRLPALVGHRTTPTSTSAPSDGGLGFATQSPNSTPLPYTYATPTSEVTQTPSGGTPTPTSGIPPTFGVPPTQPTGGQAILQVSRPVCNPQGTSAVFVVSAVGNGQLTWQATSQQKVSIQPSNGVVDQSHPNTVIVTFAATLKGIIPITVSAQPGNQQQTMVINCRPLP